MNPVFGAQCADKVSCVRCQVFLVSSKWLHFSSTITVPQGPLQWPHVHPFTPTFTHWMTHCHTRRYQPHWLTTPDKERAGSEPPMLWSLDNPLYVLSPSAAQELLRLTASVLETADGVGQQPYAAQEASALLLVDLFVVPHTDGDGVGLPDVPVRGETGRWAYFPEEAKNRKCGYTDTH